jgi:hypothetical protein
MTSLYLKRLLWMTRGPHRDFLPMPNGQPSNSPRMMSFVGARSPYAAGHY